MSQVLYRAFATGTDSRQLVPYDSNYKEAVYSLMKDDGDFYESLYLYTPEHFKTFKKTHSLAGIKDVSTDRLVFDFDSNDDLEFSRKDAAELVSRLYKLVNNHHVIRIFYSGNKGFHVEMHLNSYLTRPEFSNIVDNFAGDLETFDKRIRDEQRLFRYPMTRHQKTGYYKIPLTIDQLSELSIQQIQKLATDQTDNDLWDIIDSWVPTDLPVQMSELKTKKEKKPEPMKILDYNLAEELPDLSRMPKHLTPAKYVLQEGFFEEGERNEACMILASTYKFLGYNKDHAYNMIKATLRLRATRLSLPEYDRSILWKTVVEPVYSPTWGGGTFSEEQGLLAKTIQKYKLEKHQTTDVGLVELTSVASFYKDFAINIDKNTIKLGINVIDAKVRVTTSMLVCLLAAPGAGKTSISMGILNSISKNNEKAIFFSMDMAIPQVYQRLIQRHTGHTSDQIVRNYKENNDKQIKEYDSILEKEYTNVKFCFKTGLTTGHVKQGIITERDRTGIMPKLVLIDYLECIQGPFSDSTANKALIATQLKDIANEMGVCVFLLVQPAKVSGDPSNELTSYTQIKGSSVLGEAASVIFTMFRPGFSPTNPQDDVYATINVVKNRMGELSSSDLGWHGLTGNLRDLDHQQKEELKKLRARLIREKNEGNYDNDLYSSQKDYSTSRPSTPKERNDSNERGINSEDQGDLYK